MGTGAVKGPVHTIRRILNVLWFWAGATRAAFSSASMVPVALGGAVAASHGFFATGPFLLSAAGVLAMHLGANLVNDYYDFASGADVIRDDRTPFYGGGTILVDGTLAPRQVSRAYRALFATAILISVLLAVSRGPAVIALGLAGFFCGYFYTAPPLRLSYIGLGEATIGLSFGPLTVISVYYVLARRLDANALEALAASLPVGLLVAAIVFVNEFPDRAADGACGKRTLVVRLPLWAATAGYTALVLAPFAIIAAAIRLGWLPRATALAHLAAPLALLGVHNLRAAYGLSASHRTAAASARYVASRQVAASLSTILLHLAVGLLLSLGFILGPPAT